ncbi:MULTISPECIES: hypothetical protein [unclassified Methylobacterium]|jgi:hypothetical protein|uniref:hypothetical protein n=1 Tax=unclassified Methylobacterium TaxID=2615210 RepID=UPI0011C205D5|nr:MULTISPECIES: hypothetical protein [unclassified Methylobacterium]QEE38508.1 hypothetical protein FVA80_05435 [Methylobacterium sp. WL1]TXN55816.1 hypothetical protein FV241_18320 [Methylobacterium sp. WL2]
MLLPNRSTRFAALAAAPFALAAFLAVPADAQPAAFGGPKILIHGNYCGPGNNAPLPPIDALDAACARHDACTPAGGLPSQACNLRLQHDAALVSRDPRQPEDLRALAGFVAASATLIPAEPGPRRLPASVTTATMPGAYAPALSRPVPSADLSDEAPEGGEAD